MDCTNPCRACAPPKGRPQPDSKWDDLQVANLVIGIEAPESAGLRVNCITCGARAFARCLRDPMCHWRIRKGERLVRAEEYTIKRWLAHLPNGAVYTAEPLTLDYASSLEYGEGHEPLVYTVRHYAVENFDTAAVRLLDTVHIHREEAVFTEDGFLLAPIEGGADWDFRHLFDRPSS